MSSALLIRTLHAAISKRNSFRVVRNMTGFYFNSRNSVFSHQVPSKNLHHRFMSTVVAVTDIGIGELEKFQKNKAATIIDVREIEEIKETGILPGAINIPLAEVGKAFQEDPNTFLSKYKHAKPSKESSIVFSCRSGRRSATAAQTVESLGYTNVFNFTGGWIEWENHLHGN